MNSHVLVKREYSGAVALHSVGTSYKALAKTKKSATDLYPYSAMIPGHRLPSAKHGSELRSQRVGEG